MSSHPVLIFVAGPQEGQRIVVHEHVAVAGRSDDLPIRLTEDYVSRKQFQLTRTEDGWILENLSSNGTMVNQKRYKAGKQILLGTGDVLGVGLKTEILYVAPGDEAAAAYETYRQQHAPKAAKPPKLPKAGEAPQAAPANVDAPTSQLPGDAEPSPTKPLTEEQVAQAAKKAKYKKYAIYFGIYLMALLILVLVLANRNSTSVPAGNSDWPARLTDAQIEEALAARPNAAPNATAAKMALDRARVLYDSNPWYQPGGLYECFKQYKLYLTYKTGAGFDDPTDEPKYMEIFKNGRKLGDTAAGGQEGLLVKVKRDYSHAWEFENSGRWSEALDAIEDIVRLVPEQDNQDPTYEQLLRNVFAHRQFIKGHMPAAKR